MSTNKGKITITKRPTVPTNDSMEFKLVEKPDKDKLRDCLMSPYIWSDDVVGYFIYLQHLELSTDDSIQVTYHQRLYNGVPYGRFYPAGGKRKSCAYMWGPIRSELFAESDTDIDIVNCHPTALLDICQRHKVDCPELKGYVDDRDRYIDDLVISNNDVARYNNEKQSCCTKRDLGKFVFTALIYGIGDKGIKDELGTNPFKPSGCAHRLKREIKDLAEKVTSLSQFKKLKEDINAQLKLENKQSHPGKILSFILQEEERRAVQRAIQEFQRSGFQISAYIYDGFQVHSRDEDAIGEVLERVNKGQPLQFIIKPFKKSLSQLVEEGHFDNAEKVRTKEQIEEDWLKYCDVNAEGFITGIEKRVQADELVACNDLEAAELFLEHCGDKFVQAGDSCYMLVDNQWKQGTGPLLEMIMKLKIKKLKDDELLVYSENVSSAENIKKAILSIAKTDQEFIFRTNDSIRDHLFYKNCIYSLKDNKFLTYDECPLRPFYIINKEIEKQILPLDDERMVLLKNKVFCCFQDDSEFEYYMGILSRAMFGHVEDKVFYPVVGGRDSGKGTLETCLVSAFEKYVATATLPIAKTTADQDPAAANRQVLTLNHNIARIAISNESRSTHGKAPVIDGNYIKGVIASGGDRITARVLYGQEVETAVNCIYFFNLNEVPKCEPANAMEKARIIYTALKFGDPTDGEFTSTVRKGDPGIKDWIRKTPWIAQAMLSYIVHYKSDKSAFYHKQPESFRLEQRELIQDGSDPVKVLNTRFRRNKSAYVLVSRAREIFAGCGKTDAQLTKFLEKNEICITRPRIEGVQTKVYSGIELLFDPSDAEECMC